MNDTSLMNSISLFLEKEGFHVNQSENEYISKNNNQTIALVVDESPSRGGKHYVLNIICKIKLEEIESVYSKYIKSGESKPIYTIIILYGNKPIFENDISSTYTTQESELKFQEFKRKYNTEIKYFFEKYTNIERVIENLTHESRNHRIVRNPTISFSIILTYYALTSDHENFLKFKDQAVKFYSKPFGSQHKNSLMNIINGIEREFFDGK
jgi:hypothetical protein